MSKRILILGVLGLALLATAVFFLREPDPQAVLRQATKNLLAEKTFHADLRATMVGMPVNLNAGVLADATSVDMLVRSDIDRTDPVQQASVSTFEFQQGLAAGGQAKLTGEARRKNGMHYLRLQEIEGVPGLDQARLADVWMKTDRPFLELLLTTDMSEQPMSAGDLATIGSALQAVDIFTIVQKLPKETIDGRKAFHYAVEMNMKVVSALLLKRRELRAGRPINSEDVVAVTNELASWNKPVGEIWIDAKTRRFKRVGLATSLGRDGASGMAAGTLLFSNEGKPVAVEAPQAEDLEKLLGPLFTKRLSLAGTRSLASAQSPQEGQNTALPAVDIAMPSSDSDGDGLIDVQEFFYGADPWNPDTDADGYTDGLEIDKGMNPVGPGRLFDFGL